MHSQLFFSFLYLTIFITISVSQDDIYYVSDPFCGPSIFNCGRIPNINYPFWTKGRPENCSYPHPGFTLDCNGDIPEIKIESKIYSVKEIDYGNRTLTIVDPGICSSLLSNSTLDFSIFDYAPNVSNLTVYYNCPHPISNPDLHIVPCLTYGNSSAYYMIHQGPPLKSYGRFGDCQVSIIPLLDSGVNRLYENLTKFGDVIKDGFGVSWERVDSGNCLDCVSSGGNCGYNQHKPDQPLCYCPGEAYPMPETCPARKGKTFFWRIVVGVFAAVVGCLLPCVAVCLWHYTKCLSSSKVLERENNTSGHNNMEVLSVWRHPIKNVEAFLQSYGSLAPKRFQYSELKKMTNSFKDKLGQGAYGSVFKGQLKDGRPVAVKVLNKSKGNGEEFLNEVTSIGRTNHVNVVSLLGFCYEHSMRALIYEFMSNGSLEKFIYSDKSVKGRILECETLIKIAIGIARGLEYLHRGCTTRILHFDIKPHNILLDDNLCPKISDFGLAKLCPEHESVVSMHDARGTMGYIAPEVYCRNIGVVSYKSDVYSYGMMVLEMVAGRKNIDAGVENTSEIYFPHWIYNRVDIQESLNLLGIDKRCRYRNCKENGLGGTVVHTDRSYKPPFNE